MYMRPILSADVSSSRLKGSSRPTCAPTPNAFITPSTITGSLFERAAAAPEARLFGIEIKAKWATKVEERRQRLGLERVRVFCGDAREILGRAGPDGCVARVFVHFPDPWWKKKHQKRRVVGVALLDELARLLAPGGEVYVQTDVEDRAALYVETLAAHPAFELAGEGGYVSANPFGAMSNRERRAAEDGLPVYRVLARRRQRLA